jgi:hypothetical protein
MCERHMLLSGYSGYCCGASKDLKLSVALF